MQVHIWTHVRESQRKISGVFLMRMLLLALFHAVCLFTLFTFFSFEAEYPRIALVDLELTRPS